MQATATRCTTIRPRDLPGRSSRAWLLAAPTLIGVAMLVGCKQTTVAEPLTQELAGNEPEAQMAFWHTLGERGLASNDEAFHGVLLYLDGESEAMSYEQRVAILKERDILPASFDRPADEALTRGTLAIIVSRVAEIRGGIFMRLFPDSARYATRELQFMGLYPRSSPNQAFSGAEFLGIMGRLEDYQRIQPVPPAAAKADGDTTEPTDISEDTAPAQDPDASSVSPSGDDTAPDAASAEPG